MLLSASGYENTSPNLSDGTILASSRLRKSDLLFAVPISTDAAAVTTKRVRMGHTPYARYIYLSFDSKVSYELR